MKQNHTLSFIDPPPHKFWRIAAVLELFALAGSLTCGALADKYSRRTTFIAACGEHTPSSRTPGYR